MICAPTSTVNDLGVDRAGKTMFPLINTRATGDTAPTPERKILTLISHTLSLTNIALNVKFKRENVETLTLGGGESQPFRPRLQ